MSRFLKNTDDYSMEYSAGIDFDDVVKLPGGGSICDIFKTKWQRRDVFVKRLKDEHRAKPLYLDALDKEFDIGVNLKHPSLPDYREFHRDYIIIDYIDGLTLADMIAHKDAWLGNERHVRRLLEQLIDVVEYLHRHNVVHCDIKPDNIMITANNKNLVLVDFDKCYTDAHSDTSGHPSKYGLALNQSGRAVMDFRGIGMVAEKLYSGGYGFRGYRTFVKACYSQKVGCEKLKGVLAARKGGFGKHSLLIVSVLTAIGVIILWLAYPQKRAGVQQTIQKVEVIRETTVDATEAVPAKVIKEDKAPQPKQKPILQEELHDTAKEKAEKLDKRIQPYFSQLESGIDYLEQMKSDASLSGQQLIDAIRTHTNKAEEFITEVFATLNDMYPGLSEREVWRIMGYSKVYTHYTRRFGSFSKEYRREIERRLEKEDSHPQ